MRGLSKLILLLLGVVFTRVADANAVTSNTGCECYGACSRSIDSLTQPWCYTSIIDPPSTTVGCGKYSFVRHAWWDECTVNVTDVTPRIVLETFDGMWMVITVSATGSMMIFYFLVGCVASYLTSFRRTVLWLPVTAACLGGCEGFLAGAVFAALVAFMYLSIPYAIDLSVSISLGVGLAVILTYASLGRQHHMDRIPKLDRMG
jgi:hypothetical protein